MIISIFQKYTFLTAIVLCLSSAVWGQSGTLQLNILLDDHQKLNWVRTYDAYLSEAIPVKLTLGQLEAGNSVVGLMNIEGIEKDLPLRGIINGQKLVLIEWYDDEVESGRLELELEKDQISGYWFNQEKSRQFTIDSEQMSSGNTGKIRQYSGEGRVFFTYEKGDHEVMSDNALISEEQWINRMKTDDCVYIAEGEKSNARYCPVSSIKTYSLLELDLFRVMRGEVPYLKNDEVFNSEISRQINRWKEKIFSHPVSNIGDNRWSMNHLIWFDPDIITDKVISGMLSVQYSGPAEIHSYSFVYDRDKRTFFDQGSFFRSHTPWVKSFQNQCKSKILSKHGELLKLFPHVTKNLNYHLTLSSKGMIVSTDFTSYFGRLKYLVKGSDIEDQVQRFAPLREYIFAR